MNNQVDENFHLYLMYGRPALESGHRRKSLTMNICVCLPASYELLNNVNKMLPLNT